MYIYVKSNLKSISTLIYIDSPMPQDNQTLKAEYTKLYHALLLGKNSVLLDNSITVLGNHIAKGEANCLIITIAYLCCNGTKYFFG